MSLDIRPRGTWDIRALYKRTARNEPSIKKIELHTCHYVARCTAHICVAHATIIARYIDVNGRPLRQFELCAKHSACLSERERARDWRVVNLNNAHCDPRPSPAHLS
jgi:hypothetical protein